MLCIAPRIQTKTALLEEEADVIHFISMSFHGLLLATASIKADVCKERNLAVENSVTGNLAVPYDVAAEMDSAAAQAHMEPASDA